MPQRDVRCREAAETRTTNQMICSVETLDLRGRVCDDILSDESRISVVTRKVDVPALCAAVRHEHAIYCRDDLTCYERFNDGQTVDFPQIKLRVQKYAEAMR